MTGRPSLHHWWGPPAKPRSVHYACALVAIVLLASCAAVPDSGPVARMPDEAVVPASGEVALTVGSFNILKIWGERSIPHWEQRKDGVFAALARENVDIVGFQEVQNNRGAPYAPSLQRADLALAFPDYGWAGAGSPYRMPTENPVMFRRDRLEFIDEGWFFLSETPGELHSISWGANDPVSVTWLRLRDRRNGQRLLVLNTHFDHIAIRSKRNGARLIRDFLAAEQRPDEVVIALGDFNAFPGSRPLRLIQQAGLRHALSGSRTGSYHGGRGITLWPRIDHILISDGLSVAQSGISYFREGDGTWPSDHFPVFAGLVYRE